MRKISIRLALLVAIVAIVGAVRAYAVIMQGSTDTPMAITDNNLAGVNSTINFLVNGTITDANVLINITHTWNDDIGVSLASPTVAAVPLWADCGGSGDNFSVTIDDAAAAAMNCALTTGTYTGTMRSPISATAMGGFNGAMSGGNWVLNVSDDSSICTGSLTSWALTLDGAPPLPVELMNFEAK